MKSEALVKSMIEHHKESLRQWKEPDGLLVPTEPDAAERHYARVRLKAAITTLEWVLT